ncbi:MAG: CocE/NonD family hydrolase, partial [candidate division Zixibacteria bacterium]|nr:CocE/NonD family hydrolase [candidate division Zixibacteria bacterium]
LGIKGKDLDTDAEAHRWFDYWLKGVKNGIMDEPTIHYYVMGAPEKMAWRSATKWPLKNEKRIRFYFSTSTTNKLDSVGRGLLTREQPKSSNEFDTYLINYSTTTGKYSRWNSVIQEIVYPDMSDNDSKSLTYTTHPLERDIEITGHPIIYLIISAQTTELDFFVYLEEIDKDDRSKYITEGCLRTSHRTLKKPSFQNHGLPYNRSNQGDIKNLKPGEPAKLVFDLLPTAYLFHKGNRIRITIACADFDNFDTP